MENKNTNQTGLPVGKAALYIAAAVAAVVLVVGFVGNSNQEKAESASAVTEITETVSETAAAETEAAAAEETQPATAPADTGADNVTFKGSYAAEDDAVIAAKDTVVATVGSNQLTLSQLQIYYWMEVRNFLSMYGSYLAYFGLDVTQPMDTQLCPVAEEGYTWQQYFLGAALESWRNYSTMAVEADERGLELSERMKEGLASMPDTLAADAETYGFADAEELVHANLGAAAGVEDYIAFAEMYYKANTLFMSMTESVDPSEEELEAFFDEHAEELGVTKETKTVDVRHILLFPEGADSSNATSQQWPEEAWSASEAKAKELLEKWAADGATEEAFAELANANSQDPGSNTVGGLYEKVSEGEMVQTFNDWCFDASRVTGDTGIVRTDYGYHVMYFSGSELSWKSVARDAYISEKASAEATAIVEKDPLQVSWKDILLGAAQLG